MSDADKPLENIHGLLIDLDGVLYVSGSAIAGAVDVVRQLRASDLQVRFITNTTTRSINALEDKLQALGFDIPAADIISAPQAARLYLERQENPVCHFLLSDEVMEDFTDFQSSDTRADAVVIGDIGDAWTYDILNSAFRLVMDGAELIALHKSKFWETDDGLQLDIGMFIAGLEFATDKPATIIGKPSAAFFATAISDMGLEHDQVAMIGDDIDSDVGGAQSHGIRGVLVQTGKYREDYVSRSDVTPDRMVKSIRSLPELVSLRT